MKPSVEGEWQGPDLVLVLPGGDVVQWAILSERQGESEECDQTSDNHSVVFHNELKEAVRKTNAEFVWLQKHSYF